MKQEKELSKAKHYHFSSYTYNIALTENDYV